jgi:hypothetical protein
MNGKRRRLTPPSRSRHKEGLPPLRPRISTSHRTKGRRRTEISRRSHSLSPHGIDPLQFFLSVHRRRLLRFCAICAFAAYLVALVRVYYPARGSRADARMLCTKSTLRSAHVRREIYFFSCPTGCRAFDQTTDRRIIPI